MNIVYKFQPNSGFDTPECCHIIELYNTAEDPGCSIAQASVKPGITTKLHSLNGVVERYVILDGTGLVEVNGQTTLVSAKDVVVIPAGIAQRITNTGEDDLVFLCVCTPRFQNEIYVAMES